MGPLMRHQDWPLRLSRMVAESRTIPFAWGTHDCCLFAANVVQELTGIDHAADLRGKYASALEATRILKARGGVRGAATAAFGAEINPKLAQRGDVVLVNGDHGESLAICLGTHCAAPAESGLATLPMSQAVTAWRIE